MEMSKIRWGLIGCGNVMLKNKKIPFINKNNTITAICTTSMLTAKAAKEKLKLKNCECYTKVEEMVKNKNIDYIYIATPPKFHYVYLKKLKSYNIPLYVEKPFVRNYKEAKEIKKLYKNSTSIFVAHYKRLTPQIQKLKRLIEKDTIGKIEYIEGNFTRIFNEKLYNNSWIYKSDISGGGRFIDIAPHILDTLYYLFGEITIKNSNIQYNKSVNTEDVVSTEIVLKNIPCKLFFDFNAKQDIDSLKIIGKKGIINTSINRDFNIYINYKNGKTKTYYFKKPKIWGIENIKAINKIYSKKNTKNDICTLNDACKIQRYIDLIMKKQV